jgi:hypothetical protein
MGRTFLLLGILILFSAKAFGAPLSQQVLNRPELSGIRDPEGKLQRVLQPFDPTSTGADIKQGLTGKTVRHSDSMIGKTICKNKKGDEIRFLISADTSRIVINKGFKVKISVNRIQGAVLVVAKVDPVSKVILSIEEHWYLENPGWERVEGTREFDVSLYKVPGVIARMDNGIDKKFGEYLMKEKIITAAQNDEALKFGERADRLHSKILNAKCENMYPIAPGAKSPSRGSSNSRSKGSS